MTLLRQFAHTSIDIIVIIIIIIIIRSTNDSTNDDDDDYYYYSLNSLLLKSHWIRFCDERTQRRETRAF